MILLFGILASEAPMKSILWKCWAETALQVVYSRDGDEIKPFLQARFYRPGYIGCLCQKSAAGEVIWYTLTFGKRSQGCAVVLLHATLLHKVRGRCSQGRLNQGPYLWRKEGNRYLKSLPMPSATADLDWWSYKLNFPLHHDLPNDWDWIMRVVRVCCNIDIAWTPSIRSFY